MKVLIVEDDEDTMTLMREIVVSAGHEVAGSAASVEEAIAVAALHCPDAAMLDIELSGPMLGIECAQLLRRQCADMPIIFITGHSDPLVVEAAAVVRPVAYLIKPVAPGQVRAALLIAEQSTRAGP